VSLWWGRCPGCGSVTTLAFAIDTSPKVRVCVDCNEKYRPINIKLAELEET
jgi:uncharacterized Zn finger protein